MAIWNRIKKIRTRRGTSLLEFAIILPALCLVMFAIITVAQLALCRQSVEEALYMSSRAASVCDDYDTAKAQMLSVARSTITATTFGVDEDEILVEIELVAGTSNTSGSGIKWEKGALAKCTLTIPLDDYISFGPRTMSSTIYVMVERPAPTYY